MLVSSSKLSFIVIIESYQLTSKGKRNQNQGSKFSKNKSKLKVTYIWSNRGRSMSISLKLVVILKIPQSQDFRTTFKQSLTCIFLSVTLYLLLSVHTQTPCHTGHIEVFMQGKCGRHTETTFELKRRFGTHGN